MHSRSYSRSTQPSAVRRSYRIDEICQRHGVSREWLYGEIRSGRLRAKKAGKLTFINDEDEDAWLAAMPDLVLPPSAA
jgi:excisionase family DNA binding protein